jgi:hypothetical protein
MMGAEAGKALLADNYRENPENFVMVGRFFSSESLFDPDKSGLYGRYWTSHEAVYQMITNGEDVRANLGLHPDYNSMDRYAVGLIFRSDFDAYVEVTAGGAAAWGDQPGGGIEYTIREPQPVPMVVKVMLIYDVGENGY